MVNGTLNHLAKLAKWLSCVGNTYLYGAFYSIFLRCHLTVYLQHRSIIWPVWLNGWVFVYELSGCGFESSCSHLNFRFCPCLEQEVPWHSGTYRVRIHSETRTWHDKNIIVSFSLHIISFSFLFFKKTKFSCLLYSTWLWYTSQEV